MFHPHYTSKLVTISSDHNHLPPLIIRNENGTVTRCLNKSVIKHRRGKPTLGPRATRYDVDRLLASIRQEMEFNRKQPTKPPVEADVASNNNSIAPIIGVKDLSSEAIPSVSEAETPVSEVEASTSDDTIIVNPNIGLPKIKIDPSSLSEKTHQKEFAKYVYHSATNRHRALRELMAGTLKSETTSSHSSVVKEIAVCHEPDHVESSHKPFISSTEENPIVAPTGVDGFLKQESGLQSNQMCIVFPPANSVAGKLKHNCLTIPSTQNTGNILYNNKILISPVKVEPDHETSVVQAKRNELYGLTGKMVNKNGDTITTNQMFMIVRPNDCVSSLQNNKSDTKVNDKVKNNMVLHNKNEKNLGLAQATGALHQPNKNTAVPSSMVSHSETTAFKELKKNKLITKKTVLKTSIPISSIKNKSLPPKSDRVSEIKTKITKSSIKPNVISIAGPVKMNSFPLKTLNLSSNTSTSAPETHNQLQMRDERGNVIPILPITIPKRTEALNMLCKKAHSRMPMKINMPTQTLPSHLILKDNNILVQCLCNQTKAPMKNNETIISGESCKTANNKGNIQQSNNLIEKISSMLPLQSPKKVQNTCEMQNNMQFPETKNIETDSPECTSKKQQHRVVVKTEALRVSDKIQTNLSTKTETTCENFKQDSETDIVSLGTEQPTASKQQLLMPDDESQIIQSASYSKQPIVSTASKDTKAKESPKTIDLDWIVPRNKDARAGQTKINTNFASKDCKQMTDNTFNLGKTSNIPEISIPVSMIPLPNESSPLVTTTTTVPKTVGNERGLVSVGTPVVMIERLSTKHKAGHLSMYSVPPKKRHYQP